MRGLQSAAAPVRDLRPGRLKADASTRPSWVLDLCIQNAGDRRISPTRSVSSIRSRLEVRAILRSARRGAAPVKHLQIARSSTSVRMDVFDIQTESGDL